MKKIFAFIAAIIITIISYADGSAWCPNSVSSFDEYYGMIYGFHY